MSAITRTPTRINYSLMPMRAVVPPSVDDMLDQIGPCPFDGLILGMCGDDLPAAINMREAPEPLLVVAPTGWGKTHFLKTTLEFARRGDKHNERQISPIVLTTHPEEWQDVHDVAVEVLTGDNLLTVLNATRGFGESIYRYALVLIDGWDQACIDDMGDFFTRRMAKRRNVVTIITTQTDDPSMNALRIKPGYHPGHFETSEGDDRMFFFAPSL